LKKTEGLKVAIAIFILYIFNYIAFAFGLEHTTDILNKIVNFLVLAAVMIFTPEIRIFLKKITGFKGTKKVNNSVLKNIETTLFDLAKEKTGALIILDESGHIGNVSESGIYLDSKVNDKLLKTIFHTSSVMHDGAVLITNGRIKYVGCKLPLSAKKREDFGSLGTRHMVAIETAENYETTVFVVSEETGSIRIATKDGFTFITTKKEFYEFFKEK
jgi:diadenylate cyclase